jgi:2-polyprenyl-6-methoxyphenol hydroxylase-like FAD-dependent oxidoreductase
MDTTVLIVGAGPTGLTLACELARRGVPFRLIEAAAGPQPGSRGKGLQPRTLEVFDDLGIVDRVLAHGRMAMPMVITGPDGQVRTTGGDPVPPRPDVPYAASVITPEWRVEEALRALLTELGGSVEFGTSLVTLEQADGQVCAELSTGDTVTARWLVGCDGGHSVVRKQAGLEFIGETRENVRMIVADIAVDGLDRDAWHMWSSAEGMVTLCPLPSTEVFQYQASIAPGQDPETTVANMQQILQTRSGRSDLTLHDPEWTSLWRANVRLVDRYRAGRVFVAGDAAHIHSPAGGQGMNTGIQDAHNLGWKFAAVVGGAAETLLDSYEDERRPVAAGVLALSDARLAETIRTHRMQVTRTADSMQLTVNYRWSELVRDDRESDGEDDTAMLRAGDRAPDAPGLRGTDGTHRLFELTRGGHWTLLSFGAQAAIPGVSSYRVVTEPADQGDIRDTEGHLANAYSAGPGTLVLIRPDGFVGMISDAGDIAAVESYRAGF